MGRPGQGDAAQAAEEPEAAGGNIARILNEEPVLFKCKTCRLPEKYKISFIDSHVPECERISREAAEKREAQNRIRQKIAAKNRSDRQKKLARQARRG